jgi:hypothetical protein
LYWSSGQVQQSAWLALLLISGLYVNYGIMPYPLPFSWLDLVSWLHFIIYYIKNQMKPVLENLE